MGATIGIVGVTIGIVGATIGIVGVTIGIVGATIGIVGATIGIVGATIGALGRFPIGALGGRTGAWAARSTMWLPLTVATKEAQRAKSFMDEERGGSGTQTERCVCVWGKDELRR